MARVVDRVTTPRGELVLRQDGEHYEVISNGVFLMDTRNGESERTLARAALGRAAKPRSILIGGLGVGFSLIEALNDERTELYSDEGTAQAAKRLSPGGVVTVWSAARSPAYERVLARHFGNVEVIEVPVPRGEPDVVFTACNPVAQTLGRDSDSS